MSQERKNGASGGNLGKRVQQWDPQRQGQQEQFAATHLQLVIHDACLQQADPHAEEFLQNCAGHESLAPDQANFSFHLTCYLQTEVDKIDIHKNLGMVQLIILLWCFAR